MKKDKKVYVDVFVAGIKQWYEFKCEEKAVIKSFIREVYSVIYELETVNDEEFIKYPFEEFKKELCLACIDSKQILNKNMTLEECGVESGNRLILF